ncbi:putative cyclin-dependent kinase F-2 [Brachypodium distachyon]|nr:putative cyclin-dependent kinase F-2 [Brachypodium distachyon]|eukprot:XP_024319303.1 putative cyclin-dependent kinase F-2 [Brachypodium distachyon]
MSLAGCTMSRWICDSNDIFGVLWIFVEISRWILVLLKNLRVRLAARLTLASGGAAGTTAGQLADLLAMIDEHTAAGTMSGKQVAEICSTIDASCHDAREIRCEKGRRWRRGPDVGSTRCYKQLHRLGKGSFGLVVKAQHRDTGQIVALKTIHARDGARRPDVGELLREACFMVACHGHPFLVGLHGVARNPDTKEYCLVMNYVGPTLHETVDRRMERHGHAFPEADVRRVMRQLLIGARAMHERRIIHRDIKPKNILIGDDDGVKICDYGVAMFTAKAELPFAQAGTPSYMAPEVLLEKPEYDERVDLWSLGCVMAELLSGQVLFERDDKMDQLRKIFDTLGVPGKRTWQGFKSTLLVQEVQQWRAQQQEAPHHDRLRELFPEEVLSKDGFHVLKGLLRCNPSKRLTAATALRSSWFKDDAINTPEADKIGGTVLARETVVSLRWVLISAWARFRQVMLSIGASALLRHKALPQSVAL